MVKRVKTLQAFLGRLSWPSLAFLSLAFLPLGFFSLGVSSLGASETQNMEDRDRWVPSFSILSGVNSQNGNGSMATTNVEAPWMPLINAPPEYVSILPESPLSAGTQMMTPYAGLSLEIMTPSLWKPTGHASLSTRRIARTRTRNGPLRRMHGRRVRSQVVRKLPRGFAHLDVSYTFGPEYNIPSSGNPGPFFPGDSSALPTALVQGAILGQGSRTTPLVQPLQVTAGAGVAFTLRTASGRILRIKPSVEYLREEIQVNGLVRRAVRVDPTPTVTSPEDAFFRTINLAGKSSHVYHGLGPGLEVELETGRSGPFKVALYASARAWKFLNNDPQSFTVHNEDPLYCPPPPPGQVNCSSESATFGFTKDDWAYGANLGFRLRWSPE